MSRFLARALALCALVAPLPLAAQSERVGVNPGDVVRLASSPDAERFSVERLTSDSLFLRPPGGEGAVVPVALKSITTLEVRRQRSRQGGALAGVLVVGGIGAAAGAFLGFSQGDDAQGYFTFSRKEKALALGGVGALAGAAIGALVGSSSASERWEPVALAEGVGLARMRSGALALTYSRSFR